MGECVLVKKLWEICRDAKDAAHVTNQHIADETGLALNTVSQYLRGDTKHPSVYTVGPICRACSVDFNIKIPSEKNPEDCSACPELAHAEQMQRIYERGLHTRSVIIIGLCVILALALVALIIAPLQSDRRLGSRMKRIEVHHESTRAKEITKWHMVYPDAFERCQCPCLCSQQEGMYPASAAH